MRYLSLLALLILSACETGQPLVKAAAENNGSYNVSYLFENGGCKVYRFRDKGQWVYFTNCQGGTYSGTDSTRVQNTTNVAH
jgi:hypothetical protein